MIVVDSSAIIAILEREPDAPIFAAAVRKAERLLISAVSAVGRNKRSALRRPISNTLAEATLH